MFLIQTIPCKDFDYESSKQLLPSEGEWVCPNPFQSLTEVPTGGDVKGMKMLHFKQRDLGGIWATPRSSKRNIQLSNDAVTAGTAPPALPCQSSALCSGGWCLSKHSPEKSPSHFGWLLFKCGLLRSSLWHQLLREQREEEERGKLVTWGMCQWEVDIAQI